MDKKKNEKKNKKNNDNKTHNIIQSTIFKNTKSFSQQIIELNSLKNEFLKKEEKDRDTFNRNIFAIENIKINDSSYDKPFNIFKNFLLEADYKRALELQNLILLEDINFIEDEEELRRNESIGSYWADKKNTSSVFLVGNEQLKLVDEKSTTEILNLLKNSAMQNNKTTQLNYLLELAVGAGRLTNIFVKYFNEIDLLEPSKEVFEESLNDLKSKHAIIKNIYFFKAEEFIFEKKYDVIFASWLIGNMSDIKLLKFLIECRLNLTENGIIIFKDNVCDNGKHSFISDSSYLQKIRSIEAYVMLFSLANLEIGSMTKTPNWPTDCYILMEFILYDQEKKS